MLEWSKTVKKRTQKRPAEQNGDFDDKVILCSHAGFEPILDALATLNAVNVLTRGKGQTVCVLS